MIRQKWRSHSLFGEEMAKKWRNGIALWRNGIALWRNGIALWRNGIALWRNKWRRNGEEMAKKMAKYHGLNI